MWVDKVFWRQMRHSATMSICIGVSCNSASHSVTASRRSSLALAMCYVYPHMWLNLNLRTFI